MASLAPLALWPLAATELALSAVLLAGVRVQTVALVGPAAAFALIAAFTVALALRGDGDCGCWSTRTSTSRGLRLVPIFRNGVLMTALAAAAVFSLNAIHRPSFVASIAPFVTGLLLALLLVDAPQIAAVATFERRPVEASRSR
jgi:hypothetical protein